MGNPDAMRELGTVDEINVTVTGRKTGRSLTFPVWFVLEGSHLFLLPIYGSKTNWYRNVKAHPGIAMTVGGKTSAYVPDFITDWDDVERVVDLFRARYGAEDVARYYSVFDAALQINL